MNHIWNIDIIHVSSGRNCNLIKAMLSTIIKINILRTSVIAYIVLTDCIMC